MRPGRYGIKLLRILLCAFLLVFACNVKLNAQVKSYTIKDGRMYIALSKSISDAELDDFVNKFDLHDLVLKQSIRLNSLDSLKKLNWKIEVNNKEILIISKKILGFDKINPADKIIFTGKENEANSQFPSVSSSVIFGYNRFKNKFSSAFKDSTVTFFLRNNLKRNKVMLAGSFNDWSPEALAMTRTDSGWIAKVKLAPGKYWYKFILDGNWDIDTDNQLNENDGQGNVNSVFYKSNVLFKLDGYTNAKKVYVAGSFNNWEENKLAMVKTATGWELPVYLADGTHTYRFIADRKWMIDPANPNKLPNEFNEFNSVIKIGKQYLFKLNSHRDARQVYLSGSFNGWKKEELLMNKTATGWELAYTLGPGNYEYRFLADGKWVNDSIASNGQGNSNLVLEPNYIFKLKSHLDARSVFLAGDFNNWSPGSFPMKKEGGSWVFSVHLSPGKHLYKFVIDGKEWIRDPGNGQWEENEFGTGNSVIWVK